MSIASESNFFGLRQATLESGWNFRFAFRLQTNISPFASARNLSCIGSKAEDPVVRHTAFAATKKP